MEEITEKTSPTICSTALGLERCWNGYKFCSNASAFHLRLGLLRSPKGKESGTLVLLRNNGSEGRCLKKPDSGSHTSTVKDSAPGIPITRALTVGGISKCLVVKSTAANSGSVHTASRRRAYKANAMP